ncbi:heat-shock protein [Saccharophagus sp. K07]|jgi:molecular chaperone IbpA|uniref:Hsp20 family protein n=1 Tax=Saccharophagus sp. K07 TaxID=2283636 RepID=UPI001651F94D|nr:Hsp20 family protein [Saccharophagus sp. K07]MBC6907204.1 heat-shock protein [Saccharophagus sp. K07]
MNTIDLSPLYRNSIGFDRLASLIDSALRSDSVTSGYPPYNIEMLGENRYAITLAVAGFDESELDITTEKGVLTVRGKKAKEEERHYLHQGIANRAFERKFNLADYVEVTGADLNNGLLTIRLVKEVPDAMKPRRISINQGNADSGKVIEHRSDSSVTESEHVSEKVA